MSAAPGPFERWTERATPWFSLLGVIGFLVALAVALCDCATQGLRPGISLSVAYAKQTPADASVTIDEQYVGPLGYVAAHGVRLPSGQHRVSVTKTGYFPWDRLLVAGDDPIRLNVALEPIPD